jgi:hypothetical protein
MPSIILMFAAVIGAALLANLASGAEAPPLAGCYERIYDSEHLAQHKGQLVTRVSLSISAAKTPMRTDAGRAIIADGILKMWVHGQRQSFDSIGSCWRDGEGLACDGSLSAAEADTCKSKHDGVRNCRIDPADAGAFKVDGKPDGVTVTIPARLELVPAPYDGGPFLTLSGGNAESHAFLLKRVADACD